MRTVMRRIRGVLGMGLIWAMGGAAAGGVIELLDNVLPGGLAMASAVDMWPQTLAIPGFLGGVIFGVVLLIAGGRRRFHELSMAQFAGWGALAGALLGAKGVSAGLPALVLAITTGGGAIAAAGSLALARRASTVERLSAGSDHGGNGNDDAVTREIDAR